MAVAVASTGALAARSRGAGATCTCWPRSTGATGPAEPPRSLGSATWDVFIRSGVQYCRARAFSAAPTARLAAGPVVPGAAAVAVPAAAVAGATSAAPSSSVDTSSVVETIPRRVRRSRVRVDVRSPSGTVSTTTVRPLRFVFWSMVSSAARCSRC